MLRIMQERTRHETKPTIFGYFFDEFLQLDVYIPHPPTTMHSLRKQFFFAQMIYHFMLFLQKIMIT